MTDHSENLALCIYFQTLGYIKQVHVLYATHCILFIFILINIIAVLVEVGDNFWRAYRGSRARLPYILHLAELWHTN